MLAALCALVLTAPAIAAPSRTVRVGLYENEPKIHSANGGQPAGIFADLLAEVAEDEGWTLEWVPGTWDEGLKALQTGRIDIMPDVAVTPERQKIFDFHEVPVIENWSYVYTAPGVHAERLAELEGKRVAVLQNTVQESVFRQMVEGFGHDIGIVRVSSLKEAFRLASERKVDAAIANHLFGDYFYQRYGLEKSPIVLNQVPMYYAVQKGRNADLLTAIDAHLSVWMKQRGSVYYQTLDKYTTGEAGGLPWWTWYAVGGTAALLVLATGVILLLRWQVRVQTRHLAKAEETLRLAADAAEEGIFDWYPQTREVDWTPRNWLMLGYEPREFPSSFDAWTGLIHPDDRNRVVDAELRSIDSGDGSFTIVYRLKKKNGEWMWTESRGKTAAVDAEGRAVRVVGTNADITDRKRVEDEINTLNAELEERVAQRTAQLEAANKDLESFSYSVSHDLRAPLRAISGFSQIVSRRHREALNEEGRHYVDNIVQAAERMAHLIEDLLTYSRLGRQALHCDLVQLRAVTDALALEFATRLEECGGTLEIAGDLPELRGDRTRVAQILTNLVDNALTYRKADVAPHVRIGWRDEGAHIVLSVTDNGIGIAPEHQEKVFNIFQRLHSDEEYPGTGIGLANVKKCAEMLSGKVWLESAAGEGSTFFVRLPKEC